MQTISDLTRTHNLLDDSFLWHQEFLMKLNWASALDLLKEFARELNTHIDDEEEVLLPLYEKHAPIFTGGSAEQFRLEHVKIRAFISDFIERESALLKSHCTDFREAIKLMDDQAQFKHLMAHHDQRERNFLYPALDKHLPTDERKRVLVELEFRHH